MTTHNRSLLAAQTQQHQPRMFRFAEMLKSFMSSHSANPGLTNKNAFASSVQDDDGSSGTLDSSLRLPARPPTKARFPRHAQSRSSATHVSSLKDAAA